MEYTVRDLTRIEALAEDPAIGPNRRALACVEDGKIVVRVRNILGYAQAAQDFSTVFEAVGFYERTIKTRKERACS